MMSEYIKNEHLHNVRRTLERGIRMAQHPPMDKAYVDIFTHALDELQRAGLNFPEKETRPTDRG